MEKWSAILQYGLKGYKSLNYGTLWRIGSQNRDFLGQRLILEGLEAGITCCGTGYKCDL
jgi:hypothetical protein